MNENKLETLKTILGFLGDEPKPAFEKQYSHLEIKNGVEILGKHICVLQRGWVLVGDLYKNGSEYSLENGSVVRSWGTTKGLGELAMNGPLPATKLDPIPLTKFHELTVVLFLECSENWK